MVVFVNAVMPRRCHAIEATSLQGDVMPREMDIRLSAEHLFECFRSSSHDLKKMH
jgi:DNA-binding transcriptional regulator YdaS (Cro superfamily)